MKHRPFHKLDVNATNKIQLDHYFQLLTSLPASILVSLKYDLVEGKKVCLKEFEFSFFLPFLCPFFSLSFLPSLTAKISGYSFDGVDT